MPSYQIILSPEAAAELESIHRFISNDSIDNAAKTMTRILDAIDQLEDFPNRNIIVRQSKKIKHAVRSLPVKPYIVYFRVLEEQKAIRILTVRHGARKQPKRFG